MIRRRAPCLALIAGLLASPGVALDDPAPLSAIEWLDQAFRAPSLAPDPAPPPAPPPPLADRLDFEPITAQPLDAPDPDTTGLFAAARIDLPRAIWGPASMAELRDALDTLPGDTVPAAQQLTLRLLLAEFAPPVRGSDDLPGAMLAARVAALIRFGALEQASQLLDAADLLTAPLAAKAFDVALLLGEEDRACARMRDQVRLVHAQAAQIFCLARQGDWPVAHAALQVATALNTITTTEAQLLARFLYEEEAGDPAPAPPTDPSPLAWRIMEALGDPVTTATLPVAFAHADLRGTAGWRAQLDAAERLTRAGILQANRLLGLYAQSRPAASGGVWERVRVVQELDRALDAQDADTIAARLIEAWPLFAAVELDVALAQMFAPRLAALDLPDEAGRLVWKFLVLAQDDPARIAALAPNDDPLAHLITALATGAEPPETEGPAMAAAIAAAFRTPPDALEHSDQMRASLDTGSAGLVLLRALSQIADAAAGDPQLALRGLAGLRALALEAPARQIAIELLLLQRRG